MTDYTARNVLLKDSSGNYLIPYTEKADLSLGNLNSAGKAYVAIKGYDSTATYSLNEVVLTVVSGSVLLYRSLVDNNTASLSDTTKWEEVELGGGSDIDNSTITLNSNDEIQTVGVIDNRSGSTLKLWTGTRSQYNAIQNKDANTLYNITDDTGNTFVFRNIGEIVESTVPLVDAGLHLADGALISGSGSYAAFVTHMAGLVSTNPDLFETEANWQSSVSTYGVCGKYVYDSMNNTVRLPKLTGFIEGTLDATALGDLIQAGLPDITGTFGCDYTNTTRLSGAMYAKSTYSGATYAVSAITSTEVGFDASRSNSIYGNSTTVQPQSTKVFYYVVISTSTKTAIEVDIDEIASDLNGKADTDLSNLSNGLANTICTTAATTTSSASSARPAVVVRNYRNGENWYRVWSDGWIEQGGAQTNTSSSGANSYRVSLLYPFATTGYTVMRAPVWGASWGQAGTDGYTTGILSRTTTYFECATHANSIVSKIMWYACGY